MMLLHMGAGCRVRGRCSPFYEARQGPASEGGGGAFWGPGKP